MAGARRTGRKGAEVDFVRIDVEFPRESEFARLVSLVALSGIAIAQPLLAVFGDNPEFFAFINARRIDTVVFALTVVVVPPLVLFGLGLLGRVVGPTARSAVHLTIVAGLVYLIVVQVLSQPSPSALAIVAAVGCAVGGTELYRRYNAVRIWSRLLVVVPVIALFGFVFGSATTDLFDTGDVLAAGSNDDVLLAPVDEVAPVIFLLFDELPTRMLLGPNGQIDADRFPNFARLASESTWYRSHSTTSPQTTQAVPSILTGRVPRDVDETFAEHPDNIFGLFGQTHHLTVSESFTSLCPAALCGFAPIPPPSIDGTSAVPTGGQFDAGQLYERTTDVFLDRVLPGRDVEASFSDFDETLEVVTTPATTPTTTVPPTSTSSPTTTASSPPTTHALNFWAAAGALGQAQPKRFTDMRDLIAPTDTPTLYFLHLVVPHIPWRFYEDGTRYSVPSDDVDIDADSSNQWILDVNETRLRQQTRHADGLLGELLARFDEAGTYDDAVVVVTADHGVNLALDAGVRDFAVGAASDVMYSPLFIKEPGQTEGRIDESNAMAYDIFPTVAAAAGLRIPWSVDGLDLAAGITDGRGDTKTIYRFAGPLSAGSPGTFEYSQPELDAQLLRPGIPAVLTNEGDIRPLYDQLGPAAGLLDASISDADTAAEAAAVVPARASVERPSADDPPIGIVTGTIEGDPPSDDTVVVIAVDDRIVALSPIVAFQDDPQAFVGFLPPGVITAGGTHRLDLGWWSADTGLQLLDLR